MLIFFVNVIFKIKRYIEIKKSTVNCHKFYNVFKCVYLSGGTPITITELKVLQGVDSEICGMQNRSNEKSLLR